MTHRPQVFVITDKCSSYKACGKGIIRRALTLYTSIRLQHLIPRFCTWGHRIANLLSVFLENEGTWSGFIFRHIQLTILFALDDLINLFWASCSLTLPLISRGKHLQQNASLSPLSACLQLFHWWEKYEITTKLVDNTGHICPLVPGVHVFVIHALFGGFSDALSRSSEYIHFTDR